MPVRFVALDSWRGIAAILVCYGHLKTTGGLSGLALAPMTYRFVDFFFVLSGFVIAHSSGEKLAAGFREAVRFGVRRIARLWPLHLFVLGLFVAHQLALLAANRLNIVAEPVAFTGSFDLAWLPANIAMVQAWGATPFNTWNEPAWSISAEMFAYLFFALACLIAQRSAWIILGSLGALSALYGLAVPDAMVATTLPALIRCIAGFGLGVLAHRIWMHWRKRAIPWATAFEIAAFASVFAAVILIPRELGALVAPLFAAVVLLFAFEQGAVSRMLRGPAFTYLGERSYSIYLIHAFLAVCAFSAAAVLGVLGTTGGTVTIALPAPFGDFAILAFLAITVACAHFTYRWIELPGQALGRAVPAPRGGGGQDHQRMTPASGRATSPRPDRPRPPSGFAGRPSQCSRPTHGRASRPRRH